MPSKGDIIFDKGLPINTDAERLVLASILMDDSNWPNIALSVQDFGIESHRVIFNRMKELKDDGEAIDRVTLINILTRYGEVGKVGGLSYIVSLDEGMPAISNIDSYIRIVKDNSIRRRLIFAGQAAVESAIRGEESVTNLLVSASRSISGLEVDNGIASELLSIEQIFDANGGVQNFFTNTINPGVSTGFPQIDDMWLGFQEQNGYVIAGRPGMGKTALFTNMMEKMGESGVPNMLFSLEMRKEMIVMRMACERAQVPLSAVIKKNTDSAQRSELRKAAGEIAKLPIYIDDTSNLTIGEIARRLNKAVRERGIRVFGLDYIQIVNWQGDKGMGFRDENSALTYVSKVITMLARQNNISSVILSQLIKAPDKRDPGKRPTASEIRGTGSIEQDATGIIAAHLPYKYKPTDQSLHGKAEAIVLKSRNGSTGIAHLEFLGKYTKFVDPGKPLGMDFGDGE